MTDKKPITGTYSHLYEIAEKKRREKLIKTREKIEGDSSAPPKEESEPIVPKRVSPASQKEIKKTNKPKINKENKQDDNIASNITILQLTDKEIEELREPAYKAQTFRLTEKEIDWVKDIAYSLSKEVKRGKVSQADVLRISFKLFASFLAIKKADLIKILERIK